MVVSGSKIANLGSNRGFEIGSFIFIVRREIIPLGSLSDPVYILTTQRITNSRKCQDNTNRKSICDSMSTRQHQVPKVFRISVFASSRNEFRTISNRTSSNSKKIYTIYIQFLDFSNSLHQSIKVRVSFDSTKLMNLISFQSSHNLIIRPVTLDAASSICHIDNPILGNQRWELGNLSFSEDYASSISKVEIANSLHNGF